MLTEHLIDVVLGLYVYTYPKLGKEVLKAYIPRPWGFKVYEVVNELDLGVIALDAIAKNSIEICDEGYVYIVEKTNIDSVTLCSILKKTLRCSLCETLGLKDTKAVVRQVAILRNCSNVVRCIENDYSGGHFKAVFWQCGSTIIHNNNRFLVDIVVEDNSSASMIIERLDVMKNHGFAFLNFFGYQRFGTLRPVTHLLGKLLIKREWREFLDTLCKSVVKHGLQTPEHIACSLIHRYRDELEVVRRIPKSYLVLYINAYQSYMFNVILSKLWLKLVEYQGLSKALKTLEDEYRYLPIIGSKTYVDQIGLKEIVDEVLGVEGLQLEDFNIKSLGIEVRGGTRKTLEHAYNVMVQLRDNTLTLSFNLNRGCYASVFIRELLKIDPYMYV